MNRDPQPEQAGVEAALLAWQRKATDVFLPIAAVLHLPVIILVVTGHGPPLSRRVMAVGIGVYLVVVSAALAHRVDYRTRLSVVFVSGYLLAAALHILLPRGPYAQVGLFTLPILILVFLGTPTAKIATVANVVILASAPLLRLVPAVPRVFAMQPEQAVASGVVWMQALAQASLLVGVMVLLHYFKRFLIDALADQCRTTLAETRRLRLERTFLHDLMNTASALKGFAWLLDRDNPKQGNGEAHYISSLSTRIIDEIVSHKQLVAAEHNELELTAAVVNPLEVLDEVFASYNNRDLLNGRSLRIDADSRAYELESDRALLVRVLSNMVKNAIEGSAPGELVTLGCRNAGDWIEFWVHNPTYIPENVRKRVFHRSFSTKGPGRGLGTYGMKLLTERYLSGTISFRSVEGKGTTFVAAYPVHPEHGMR